MSSSSPTHYDVLGLNPTALPGDIRTAFKNVALRCHPDRLPKDMSDQDRAAAVNRFQDSVSAADCLLDAQRRARYDAFILGSKAVDIVGRVSETCSLSEDFEASEEDPSLFVKECRCGGTYSVMVLPPKNKKGEGNSSGKEQPTRKYSSCDSCSLVVEVRLDE